MRNKKRGVSNVLLLNSKSQAAIFLVMSLVILLFGVLYLFYQRQAVNKEFVSVNSESAPVRNYVDDCIKNVAEEGLTQIGLGGGYIDIPQNIGNDPKAYLTAFPGAGFKTPFWWHDGIEAVPPEDFIKRQLIKYVKSGLKNCINNFEPFSQRFEINELKEPNADVQFNENDVSVKVAYPVEIIKKSGDFKALLENFEANVPVRFKKVYELANLIMERENKDYFIERKTIDLYSIDPEIPTTDVEATCKTKIWELNDIKQKLKTLVRGNLPYIRILGSSYNPSLYVPNPNGGSSYSESYYQQHYIWEIDKNPAKFKNMKVAFAYDNWPLEVYARPSENGILRSNSEKGANMLSFFCLHLWHFTYDISYPVMVSIYDQESAASKPYQFNFAFKVSIDHNQPNRVNTGTRSFESVGDASSDDYCNSVQNEITVFTVNNATGDDIKDVNLTFVCGRFYCDMGKSEWLSFGAAAGIRKRFPYCVNGIIIGSKQGFADAKSFMQTDADGRSYVMALNPIKEFKNYRIMKHLLSNPGIAEELAPNEKASILIKGTSVGYENLAVYPKEADFPLSIPDGKDATYEVNIYLVDEQSIKGGYIGNWTVNKNDLLSADEVVFHVVEQGPASEDDRILFVSGLSSYSRNVPAPELKSR